VAVHQQEWVFMPVPAIINKSLFSAAQQQLRENRTRARQGLRRPVHLLQGLTCCALCGYAFYGKTIRQRGKGRQFRDFRYYRCTGTDGYRFGGERICSNTQIHAERLETKIWEYICQILKDPASLVQRDQADTRNTFSENVDVLEARRQKLQRGMERLIDSFAEGVIDRDQFTIRMDRTKARIAEIETSLSVQTADRDQQIQVRSLMTRLAELSGHLRSHLNDADWTTKRETIRALVQRIEIGITSVVVLRLPAETSARTREPVMVTLSRA
jgi:site-specific DNA recombinase